MNLYPFDDVLAQANEAINNGYVVYQQFKCAGCDNKLTMDVPDTFYTRGTCDKCGFETDIKATGQNFMAVLGELPPNDQS